MRQSTGTIYFLCVLQSMIGHCKEAHVRDGQPRTFLTINVLHLVFSLKGFFTDSIVIFQAPCVPLSVGEEYFKLTHPLQHHLYPRLPVHPEPARCRPLRQPHSHAAWRSVRLEPEPEFCSLRRRRVDIRVRARVRVASTSTRGEESDSRVCRPARCAPRRLG